MFDRNHVGNRGRRLERVDRHQWQPERAAEHPVERGFGVGHVTRVADQVVIGGRKAHLGVDDVEAGHGARVEPGLRALQEVRR